MPKAKVLRGTTLGPADIHWGADRTRRRMRLRHESTGFSPGDGSFTGLVAWYDFSDRTTLWKDTTRTSAVTADADVILGVSDKSSTGSHLLEATNGPTYKVSIFNSRSIARFDGVNDVLRTAADPAMNLEGNLTSFFVLKTSDVAANAILFHKGTVNVAGEYAVVIDTSEKMEADRPWITAGGHADPTAVSSVTASIHHTVISGTGAGQVAYYADGAANATTILPAGTAGTTVASLGAATNGTTGPWAGDLCEVLLYEGAMSAANQNLVGNYLAAKWGLTWTTVT